MIRPAFKEDEKNLRTLCTSVYKNDYVLEHLSTWLQEGSMYIYQKDNYPIGMIRLTFSKDGKAHLGSIRVHPDFRERGVGTALTEFCMTSCKTDVVRLAIMDNNPSQALARKMGFSHVATFTFLLRTAENVPPGHTQTRTAAEALSLLRKSPLFIQSHSLISSSFTFYTPTLENMENLLLIGRKGKGTNNLAIFDFDVEEALKKAVQIAYCDPDPDLIRAALREAAQRNAEEIWAVIPKNAELVTCFESSGFEPVEWGKTIRVFEKHLQAHQE